jgi:hypothetical protein
MSITCPCGNAPGKSSKRRTSVTLTKKDFLHVLRRARIPEETIRTADKQLHDPIDQVRDGIFLVTHGLDRDQLISRMGGSP